MTDRRLLPALLVIGAALALSACVPLGSPTPAPVPVTVQLNWTHSSSFGGYYTADQNGYYAAEGIAVSFLEGNPNADYIAPVLDGRAQFGSATADALILARAEGKEVRSIAVIYRRSPTVFFALAATGISRPQDLAGKKIRVSPNLVSTLHAMMTRVGISPDQYTEVILPSDVALFASGEVPVWGSYLNVFASQLMQAGYKLNILYPDDYGVHFYGNSIFARDDYVANNPDVVRRFLRATLKGWTFAVEDPTAAGRMVAKYRPGADVALEIAQMTSTIPFVVTGEDYVGWMRPEIWAGMEATLREQGILTKTLDLSQVYTLKFLQEIYAK